MGYSIAWLAVHGAVPEELLARLHLRPTGEDDEDFSSPVAGGRLKRDWYLVVGKGCDHRLVDKRLLQELSLAYELVACSVEEHVMYSSASGWRGGKCIWSIIHDSSHGMFDLQVAGIPPDSFESRRTRHIAEQEKEGGAEAEVDYIFEIPLGIAKDLTGFKHDERIDCLEQKCLVALADTRPRPCWKLW